MLLIIKHTAKITLNLLFSILLLSCKTEGYEKITRKTVTNLKVDFVSSETCKSCHEQEYALWKGSHHDLAMQVADTTTVLGDFNNTRFTSNGVHYKFFQKNDVFYVNTEGEGGVYADYKIVYTFGVYPLQQYLIAFPGGRYQCLLAAWDAKDNKWFHLQPNETIHHEEWLHWTGGSMTWNSMCADCHSTNLHKNFDAKSENYQTFYSILNVSCEACHGSSSEHVAFYEQEQENSNRQPPPLYMGNNVPPKELVQKCARCHSRRSQLTNYFDYNGHYLDHYDPSLIIEPVYELDGQIKDEDYVYGSFMQSKMYHNNVSCKDCHDMHSMQLKKQGNDLCMTCHALRYNSYEHHFHKMDTDAAQCINCHMTGKTYMGNDFRRDHSFRVPRPDQSVSYGTPNACNSCHTDQSAQWAAKFVSKNYGATRSNHFSDKLLEGYSGNTDAFYAVFSNGKYPDIARATALDRFTEMPLTLNQIEKILPFLKDSSALVKNQAIRGLDKLQELDFSENIQPMLLDSVRLIRISAARYLNMRNISINENAQFKKAQQEYETMLAVNADFASGQHQIALQQMAQGNTEAAIITYEKALTIDNYYNPSRLNLALLAYNQGNTAYAEELYLKVTEQEPEYSYPYFMLGLLYNEQGATEKSLKYLELATKKQPVIERAFYNYALKLQESGDFKKSIEVLDKVLVNNPENEELLYLKLVAELNSNNRVEAFKTCSLLLEIAPKNQNYLKIINELSIQM